MCDRFSYWTSGAAFVGITNLNRGTKKQVGYGYVVHLFIKDEKPSITVLWMRGTALPPKDTVVTYSDAELPKLDSFRNNYRDAAKQGEPPMHITWDMLANACTVT